MTPKGSASAARAVFPPVEEQLALLMRGCVECYNAADLRKMLEQSRESGKPLRVKLGLDPTRPHLHVGHTVVLRKLRQFQDFGHKAVLIIGDYTAMVGDPSGRSKTRPQLTQEQVEEGARSYFEQAGAVIDIERAEIRRNGEWFSKMNFMDVLRLLARTTLARILERDDFAKRHAANQPISLHELAYPLMQGHDSVAIEADIEIGGTDQTFNLLMGRRMQEDAGLRPQVCLTLPLLEGLDGVEKMSKSLGNTIDVRDPPDEMFGKTMSIGDRMMGNWFTLLTAVPETEIAALTDAARTPPREAKDRLAREVVAFFHGRDAAEAASAEFVRRFRDHALPADIPVHKTGGKPFNILDLLVEVGFASSKSEARRGVEQGGVRLIDPAVSTEGETITDIAATIQTRTGLVLRFGKRRFVRFG